MFTSLAAILVFMPMEIYPPKLLWCAQNPNNKHISYCFEKETECKNFSILKNKQLKTNLNTSKCKPTKI